MFGIPDLGEHFNIHGHFKYMGFLIYGLGRLRLGVGFLIHGFAQHGQHHSEHYLQHFQLYLQRGDGLRNP